MKIRLEIQPSQGRYFWANKKWLSSKADIGAQIDRSTSIVNISFLIIFIGEGRKHRYCLSNYCNLILNPYRPNSIKDGPSRIIGIRHILRIEVITFCL